MLETKETNLKLLTRYKNGETSLKEEILQNNI